MSQFPASGAREKRMVVMTMDCLRRKAAAGRREAFEKYPAASPAGPPVAGNEYKRQHTVN